MERIHAQLTNEDRPSTGTYGLTDSGGTTNNASNSYNDDSGNNINLTVLIEKEVPLPFLKTYAKAINTLIDSYNTKIRQRIKGGGGGGRRAGGRSTVMSDGGRSTGGVSDGVRSTVMSDGQYSTPDRMSDGQSPGHTTNGQYSTPGNTTNGQYSTPTFKLIQMLSYRQYQNMPRYSSLELLTGSDDLKEIVRVLKEINGTRHGDGAVNNNDNINNTGHAHDGDNILDGDDTRDTPCNTIMLVNTASTASTLALHSHYSPCDSVILVKLEDDVLRGMYEGVAGFFERVGGEVDGECLCVVGCRGRGGRGDSDRGNSGGSNSNSGRGRGRGNVSGSNGNSSGNNSGNGNSSNGNSSNGNNSNSNSNSSNYNNTYGNYGDLLSGNSPLNNALNNLAPYAFALANLTPYGPAINSLTSNNLPLRGVLSGLASNASINASTSGDPINASNQINASNPINASTSGSQTNTIPATPSPDSLLTSILLQLKKLNSASKGARSTSAVVKKKKMSAFAEPYRMSVYGGGDGLKKERGK